MTNNYTYRIPEQQNLWEASRVILRRLRTLVNTPMIGINERGKSVEDLSAYDILREAMANQMAHANHFSPRRSCIHVKVTFDLQAREAGTENIPVKLTDTQQKVLELIANNPSITHFEIANKLSINEKTAKRATQALRESGLLKREGSDKNGIWKLLDKTVASHTFSE